LIVRKFAKKTKINLLRGLARASHAFAIFVVS